MAALEKELLLKLDKLDHLPEFLHQCVNNISRGNSLVNSTHSDTEWTGEELKRTTTKIQNFYRQCAINNHFSFPNDSPEKSKYALAKVYESRQKDIVNALMKENFMNNGHHLVENIDWKLKWVLGSSQLATIREPVCQVELGYLLPEKNSTGLKKSINFEVHLEKLDELISLLDNLRTELNGHT